jgi:transcriptional regulator with XRE-family HTH domain
VTTVNRADLAAFLRSRRARLTPRDAGLPDTGRRHTPGLRRQEVAQLAGMSVDYYIRLEQGRGPRPSRQVLSALARALLLNGDEREYLFLTAETGQRLIAYCAAPGSPTEAAFIALAALATQSAAG